jgi:IPT/TIG domain
VLTSISPRLGSTLAATPITLTGSGFRPGSTARAGTRPCANLMVVSATQATCTVPASPGGVVGSVGVTITDEFSQASAPLPFEYAVAPVVTSITPNRGRLAGDSIVTINGSGFADGSVIRIGPNECPLPDGDATTIYCRVAAGMAGTVDVTVTAPNGLVGVGSQLYTYVGPPTFTSITPNSGPVPGGNMITVRGTGFAAGMRVSLGASNCAGVVVSSSEFTCTAGFSPDDCPAVVSVTLTDAFLQTTVVPNAYSYQ